MHLRSITLKGFKSFPDRTKLDFAPGVSVVVGPNGSGKSNVTDAVLWAMGEQSPLAVRGQSMQDVIFSGGHGVQARGAAEVELVLDNSDGTVDLPVGEISIVRRLDRSGEGEYRLNGARCRLVDVLEVLSDTGLGKEMHSVVSQGRVESIVTSKPKDRRLLIEEAAGLGKHRKRRRRAQLKLDRTQENLDRALDVEREARSRLKPLKRQAEAAELHERLERQTLESRWELGRDELRERRAALGAAQAQAAQARVERDAAEAALGEVAVRRERAERALAERGERRDAIARRAERARTACDRIELRLERTGETLTNLGERLERRRARLAALEAAERADAPDDAGGERIAAIESELLRLDAERAEELERELAALAAEHERAVAEHQAAVAGLDGRRAALAQSDEACEVARGALRAAERGAEQARRDAARVGAELAAANQYLRSRAGAPRGERSLSDDLEVEPGCELAVAAALGGRLSSAIVADLHAGEALLARLGADGGSVLIAAERGGGAPATGDRPPVAGARRLADVVRGPDATAALARRLLADAWLVDDLAALSDEFTGVAVTPGGRAWLGAAAELVQAAQGGGERILAERNRRDALIEESQGAARAEQVALAAVETASRAVAAANATRDGADRAMREAERAVAACGEAERRSGWLIEERRRAPEQGAGAVRRAQLEGELAAERRVADRARRERAERATAIVGLREAIARDEALAPAGERLAAALGAAREAVRASVSIVEAELAEDRRAGEGVAAELRDCASVEAQIQQRLRGCGDALTAAEVRAQQARDQEAESAAELGELGRRLGLPPEPAPEPLAAEQAEVLRARIERLLRRREQLGPVNPLAKAEYEEALAHVEELERQRTDLETAMRELRTLIRDTDRQIRVTFEETFAAAAANFEELVAHCFPGGRGRLRLVREDAGPRPVLGGTAGDGDATLAEDAAEAEAQRELGEPEDDLGVEIEITPAGKSMKRLSLLSGGEKSMTAISFLFAVFLAKPCPFYILDEVEAALDDLNIDRFLDLLRSYRDRAQFIVVTHQKRTMEAADMLYGVSMGGDGVSKVVSRRLPRDDGSQESRQAAA